VRVGEVAEVDGERAVARELVRGGAAYAAGGVGTCEVREGGLVYVQHHWA
jgi:hypothetical protein